MLISFSTMVLASQLVIAVADDVPKFDIERGCRIDSASAYDPNAGLDATIKRRAADEQEAKDQLQMGAWTLRRQIPGAVRGVTLSVVTPAAELLVEAEKSPTAGFRNGIANCIKSGQSWFL
jgi:hypothetical protein